MGSSRSDMRHSGKGRPIVFIKDGEVVCTQTIAEAAKYLGTSTTTVRQLFYGCEVNGAVLDKERTLEAWDELGLRDIEETDPAREKVVARVMLETGTYKRIKASELEDPMAFICKYDGSLTVRQIAQILGIKPKDVREMYDRCWDSEYYRKMLV